MQSCSLFIHHHCTHFTFSSIYNYIHVCLSLVTLPLKTILLRSKLGPLPIAIHNASTLLKFGFWYECIDNFKVGLRLYPHQFSKKNVCGTKNQLDYLTIFAEIGIPRLFCCPKSSFNLKHPSKGQYPNIF